MQIMWLFRYYEYCDLEFALGQYASVPNLVLLERLKTFDDHDGDNDSPAELICVAVGRSKSHSPFPHLPVPSFLRPYVPCKL